MHRVTKTVLVGSLCLAAAIMATKWAMRWEVHEAKPHYNDSAEELRAPISQQTLSDVPVRTQMKNVDFRIDEHIHDLRGELVGTKKGPPTFDDKDSFRIEIGSAEVGIGTSDLSDLMNRYVIADHDSPLKDLKITTKGNQIRQTGILRKAIGIPFEMEGSLQATPGGQIRLRTTAVKAAHIPVKGLMDLLGLRTARLIKLQRHRGLSVETDDLILSPEQMIPAPRVHGCVRAVRVDGDRIILIFGPSKGMAARDEKPLSPPCPASNYMYFRGGTLRFGKLTMVDADLQIIDADPEDPFYFYLDRYNEQLVGGYSKSTASYGLIVFMPDFDKIGRGSAGHNDVTSKGTRTDSSPCRELGL